MFKPGIFKKNFYKTIENLKFLNPNPNLNLTRFFQVFNYNFSALLIF